MRSDIRPVVFVAPFFAETTLRFVAAAASQPEARVGLISQDPAGLIPAELRRNLAAHVQIGDGLDAKHLIAGIRKIAAEIGPPERLLGALEQLQVPLAEAREALGIPGSSVDVAKNFRDKSRMKDVLRAANVPCARHRVATSPKEALRLAEELGYPLVAKPPDGAGAVATHRVDGSHDLTEYVELMPPTASHPLLLEEFIVGEEHSFDAVTIHGQPVWHSLTHYRPGPLSVMQNPWIQWTVLLPREVDHPRYDEIRDVGGRALKALGIGTSLCHMEWFKRADGTLAVSEVAARPPGAQFTTLISYAHDVDFYKSWARLMMFDAFEPPPRAYAAGIAFLRGQGRGRVRAIHGLDRAQQELGELVVEVRLPRQGQMPASSYEGEGYVVLRHPDTNVVANALERVVKLVRIELSERP